MQTHSTFLPPERTLMGPGPSDVNPRILNAIARPTVGHLDPLFIELMDATKQLVMNITYMNGNVLRHNLVELA